MSIWLIFTGTLALLRETDLRKLDNNYVSCAGKSGRMLEPLRNLLENCIANAMYPRHFSGHRRQRNDFLAERDLEV